MTFADLTEAEGLALLGLLKLIVRADRVLSDEETGHLERIAKAFGGDQWSAMLGKAQAQIRTSSDAVRIADTVEREEARALIYKELYRVADSDEIVPEEARILNWLAAEWKIDSGSD